VNLFSERHDVRQSVRRNTFTGKTYNSVENISQFFQQRSMPFNPARPAAPPPAVPSTSAPVLPRPQLAKPLTTPPPAPRKVTRAGMTVEHPKYGTGTVVRREGDGDNAKITVNFPRFGLKKLVEKYAQLKRN